jgi:glycosyltransferase involved in cell wall biosynthesis
MRVDILAHDGSPMGIVPEDIYGEAGRVGIGGAELAILTLCEAFGKAGHEVCFYNDPRIETHSPYFEQHQVRAFKKQPVGGRDILIIFRSPHELSYGAAGKKIWFSCDQQTVGNFREFSDTVSNIVTISPYHKDYFMRAYGMRTPIDVIDIPVRLEDYTGYDIPAMKVPHKLLFSSVPGRGLDALWRAWPMILHKVPDASLTITSDYRLWGVGAQNEEFRLSFARMEGVHFLGAIPRRTLIQEQLTSELLAYPCTYEELFCITCAEALVAGCMPVTSTMGALATTNTYHQVPGDAKNVRWSGEFASAIIEELLHPDMEKRRQVTADAWERFSLNNIMQQWERIFNS